MTQVKLSEFVTSEAKRLLRFQTSYRRRAEKDQQAFPLEMSELGFIRQYLAFVAIDIERELDKKIEAADKAAATTTTDNTAAA
jgi:hypothetical protein